MRVHRILHAHLGVLQEDVQIIELVQLVRSVGFIEMILLTLLGVLNRAVAERVGLVLMLVPLGNFTLHFETHRRLLLRGRVPHGLGLLLVFRQNGASGGAYFILVVRLVRLHYSGV